MGFPPFATPTSDSLSVEPHPDDLWNELAPLISATSRVRVRRNRSEKYPAKRERELGKRPAQPAAVMLHDARNGMRSNVLVFDLDMKNAAHAKPTDPATKIEVDRALIIKLLDHFGLTYIQDYSVSGGFHIYVPVEGGVAQPDARRLLEKLQLQFPTIDYLPHASTASGCIRPPGSVHIDGGHQMLVNNLHTAKLILQSPAPRQNFENFMEHIDQTIPDSAIAREQTPEDPAEPIQERNAPRGLTAGALRIVREADTTGYASPSEARFAALRAALNAGMGFHDIRARMEDGRWPGLNYLFERYKAGKTRALIRDLDKLKRTTNSERKGTVRKNNTSQLNAQGGPSSLHKLGFFEWLKVWRNALHLHEALLSKTSDTIGLRLVLRSIGEAASKAGSSVIEFGCRSLALACGMDYTTVSRVLKRLRNDPQPMIRLVERARGKDADSYELIIPEHLVEEASLLPYRKGRLHALRPVFRALGAQAAFVYEALEQGISTVPGLVQATGLSRSTVHDSLNILQAHKMARKDQGLWCLSSVSLTWMAEMLGATDQVAQQRHLYAAQRREWILWLESRTVISETPLHEDYPFELFEPPPQEFSEPF